MTMNYKMDKVLYRPRDNRFWGVILSPYDQTKGVYSERTFYTHHWCWWAVSNKRICLKQHAFQRFKIEAFEKEFKAKGFEVQTEKFLLEEWPNFYNKLNEKILFEVLSRND